MINTILFDLDGTLLRISQETFVNAYFKRLSGVFEKLGLDPDKSVKGVWAGTKAMVCNDGSVLNSRRFWEAFSDYMNLDKNMTVIVEDKCDSFYRNEFDSVKEIMEPAYVPARLIPVLRKKGFTIVLATNPLFPLCAVETRLKWIGLKPQDFVLVTHYNNSMYSKPNPAYYNEILSTVKKKPDECIMVGNNASEDMCAETLGIDTFLVTEFLEDKENVNLNLYKHGSQEDMEDYLLSLKL